MTDGKNEEFIASPAAFIRETAIDITVLDSSVTGRPRYMDRSDDDSWFASLQELTAGLQEVAFDLVPRSHGTTFGMGGRRFCVLRFERSSFTLAYRQAYEALKTRRSMEALTATDLTFRAIATANAGSARDIAKQRYLMTKRALDSFQTRYTARFDNFVAAAHPINGYFFPYLSPPSVTAVTNGTWGIAQMGCVDVPRLNPAHDFVFTGMMNGCALVFTDSPLGRSHFRVYHYPSVSSFPHFMTQMFWLGKPRRGVWAVEHYGSPADPNAFNFLHYDRGDDRWYLCCQPQTQHRITGGTVMSIREKAVAGLGLPGRRPLSTLQNYFPDNYV